MQAGHLVDLATEVIKLIGSLAPIPPVDGEGLRLRFLDLLTEFQGRGVRAGYAADQMDAARFALVSLIDERVLAVDAPIRSAWAAGLLQHQLFNTRNASEVFYDRLTTFRPPGNVERADVLEVFHLCLCLGFRGRYRDPSQSDLHRHLISEIAKEIRAARSGAHAPLSPAWEPRGESPRLPHPGRWHGLPVWSVPAALVVIVLLWWFGTALWTSGVVEQFTRDFPVR